MADTQQERRSSGRRNLGPFSPFGSRLVRSPVDRRPGAYATSVVALLAADLVAVVLAVFVCASISRAAHPLAQLPALIGVALAWIGMRFASGLYPGFGIAPPEALRRGCMTTLLAAIAHSAALIGFTSNIESRAVTIGSWILLFPLSVVLRGIVKTLLVQHRLFGTPVVILGGGETGAFVIRELQRDAGLGLVPVAVFDDDPLRQGSTVGGVPVLGSIESALTWEAPYRVDRAVLAIAGIGNRRLRTLSERICRRYATVSIVADMLGLGNLWVTPQSLGRCLTLRVSTPRFRAGHLGVKRTTDLVIAVPAFLATLPLIGISALLVALVDGGSPFYFQSREGINGRRLKVWKIRTMSHDAESRLHDHLANDPDARLEWERSVKLRRDPRIIPFIGSFLRRSSIDELPQLWSVIVGEMSLVGPRPLPDYHLAKLDPEFLELRRQVQPGISGYWQVMHRSDSDTAQLQAADRYYIQNWSLWLDLWVLFRTAEALVTRRGAV